MTIRRFGLIGCGAIADFHMKSLREIDCARLVCVSSRNENSAKEAGEREGADWVTDYKELLARPDIDIVCVTTSSGSHGAIGAEVLKAGKHLLMEKPIAMTVEEAETLLRLAEENGRLLSVISPRRFEESLQLAKRAVTEGRIGKLLLIEAQTPFFRNQAYYDSADWRGTIAEDGGALMNQGIHQIDLLLWLGGPVRSVCGRIATQTHRMEAEDIGAAIVNFENGAMGTIMASTSIRPGFPASIKIFGEEGTIIIVGDAITYWMVPGMEADVRQDDVRAGGASNPLGISHENHKRQIADVIEAVSYDRAPYVTGQDGLNAVKLIHAIYHSSASAMDM
ncbi:Gfo/Idh/MocA family protein [Paenibacillus solisilvae]|uniref:Gfo/Idh/MocA family protein n=1 Tax=Paenibacillus solisilvae TaxID=2486751 RepID=A0ABW0VR06_9BACL